MTNLADTLNEAVASAPEISASPGLAVGVASSGGDTQGRAQAVAHSVNTIASTQALQKTQQSSGDVLGDVLGGLSTAAGDVGHFANEVTGGAFNQLTKTLNLPLSLVQHTYRYLHDVEATHGLGDALLAGLGIAAGGVGGFVVGGGNIETGILGAEGAGLLEGQFLFHDSWNRASAQNYVDPHTHQPVSFGRDLASVLGFKRGSGTFQLVSGAGDATFDLGLDPLATALRLRTLSQEGKTTGIVQHFMPSNRPIFPEDVERIYNRYGDVRRAAEWIAARNSGEIAAEYPDMAKSMFPDGRTVAQALGAARTPEQVMNVYRDAVQANALTRTDRLPSMAFTRLPFTTVRNWARDEARPESAADLVDPRRLARHVADMFERLPYSRLTVDDASSAGEFYRLSRFTESGHTSAIQAARWANALPGERITMFQTQLLRSIYALAGRPSENAASDFAALGDVEVKGKIKQLLDEATGGARPGQNGVYGMDGTGPTEPVVNEADGPMQGTTQQVAVLQNQTGDLVVPNLADIRSAAKALKAGKVRLSPDSFLYDHVTQGFFKPLVLLTPAYAMHIALAELIPNTMRLGIRNMVTAGIAENRAKLGVRDHLTQQIERDITTLRDNLEVPKMTPGGSQAIDLTPAETSARISSLEQQMAEMQLNAIEGLVYRVLGGTRGVVPDGVRTQFSARLIHYYGGDTVDPALRAGEAYSAEVAREEQFTQTLRSLFARNRPPQYSRFFGTFGRDSQDYADQWQMWLKEIANDEASRVGAKAFRDAMRSGSSAAESNLAGHQAVKEWLDAQPDEWLQNYARHTARTQTGINAGLTPHEDWARVVMANLRAAVTGESGAVHPGLLANIAHGDWTTAPTLDAIPLVDRPPQIKGRQLVPNPDSTVQRLANIGFRRVLNPMVNFLSREPIFHAEAFDQYQRLLPAVENGTLGDGQAFSLAMERAANKVLKNVHNLHDRTQWTVTMRNIAPFYFAQEQAYRRMGRLLADDPGAFRRYQLAISGVHNVAFTQQDAQGTQYAILPGTGWMTSGAAQAMQSIGLPVQGSSLVGTGFSLSSTSVMFPLANGARPELGPVAAIPIQSIANLFPELANAIGGAGAQSRAEAISQGFVAQTVGGAASSKPLWEQLIPNSFLARVVEASLGPNYSRGFASAMAETFQSLDYQQTVATERWQKNGEKGPAPQIIPPADATPDQMQAFIDRVRNMTRIAFVSRALAGLVTPISPEVTVQNWGLPAELNKEIAKTGNLTLAIQDFLRAHPEATPFTVFQSTGQEGPAPLASKAAGDWIDQNIGFIRKYPAAGLYLMPQLTDTKFDSSVYNAQLAEHVRMKYSPSGSPWALDGYRNPDSYLGQLYIAAGNAVYYGTGGQPGALAIHLAAQQQGGGTTEQQNWDGWLKSFEAQNPIWADWKGSADRTTRRTMAVNELEAMFAHNDVPSSPMAAEVRSLLNDWNIYAASVHAIRVSGGTGVTQAQQNWQGYLTALASQHPELSAVINGVFLEATA